MRDGQSAAGQPMYARQRFVLVSEVPSIVSTFALRDINLDMQLSTLHNLALQH